MPANVIYYNVNSKLQFLSFSGVLKGVLTVSCFEIPEWLEITNRQAANMK